MDYSPTESQAGIEVLNFVKDLKEQFLRQFQARTPYNRFDILPGECYGKLIIDTPLGADLSTPMTFTTPGYIETQGDLEGFIMPVTEADQIIFQSLLTYGFQKPLEKHSEDQYAEAEYFMLRQAYNLDHGMGEIRMRLCRQYPFMRTFAVRDRITHNIEEHKDDREMFVIDIMATLSASILLRKTQDGRHLHFDVQRMPKNMMV